MVSAVAFSSDGARVVSGSWGGAVQIWDAETGNSVGKPFRGHAGHVLSVAFSPDGRRIVSGSDDQRIRIWNAEVVEIMMKL